MNDKPSRKFQKELNSGAVSLVVLAVMEQLDRPVYGYEIAKLLESLAGDSLPMNQAAIYPVLRSLQKQQLLRSKMAASDSGPPRKYYQLTSAGRHALSEWKSVWGNTTAFVDSILENSHGSTTAEAAGRAVSATTGTGRQAKGRSRS